MSHRKVLKQDSLVFLDELNRSAREDRVSDGSSLKPTDESFDEGEGSVVEIEEIAVKPSETKLSHAAKERYTRIMELKGYVKGEDEAHSATMFALHRVKTLSLMTEKREESYASNWKAKVNFPVPNVKLLKTYETLFLQMAQILDVATSVSDVGDPVASRLAVCLGSASIEVENLMCITLDLHKDLLDTLKASSANELLDEEEKNAEMEMFGVFDRRTKALKGKKKKSFYKPKQSRLGRAGLGKVGKRVRRLTREGDFLLDVAEDDAADLLIKSGYTKIDDEDRHPLLAFSQLRDAFRILTSTCTRFSNAFYGHGSLFVVTSGSQKKKDELLNQLKFGENEEILLDIIESKLLLCHGIYKFFLEEIKRDPAAKIKTWSNFERILKELDLNQLSFLYPTVLDNVQMNDENLVNEGRIDFISYLENNNRLFWPNLSASNLLLSVERYIMINHFRAGIRWRPKASKTANRRGSVF